MNWTLPVSFALFALGAALGLGQLWLHLWSPETFLKVMVTVGVFLALALAGHVFLRERRDSAHLDDKSRLD